MFCGINKKDINTKQIIIIFLHNKMFCCSIPVNAYTQWIQFIQKETKSDTIPGKNVKICSQHFTKDDFASIPYGLTLLKPGVVPTVSLSSLPKLIQKKTNNITLALFTNNSNHSRVPLSNVTSLYTSTTANVSTVNTDSMLPITVCSFNMAECNNFVTEYKCASPFKTKNGYSSVKTDHPYFELTKNPNTLVGLAKKSLDKVKFYQNSLYNANKRIKRSMAKVMELTTELQKQNLLTTQATTALQPFKGNKLLNFL
jgi:hypothetical protein